MGPEIPTPVNRHTPVEPLPSCNFIGGQSVRLLDGWPVDLLNTNRRKSMLGYFKRGMVLSADTSKSDWIYLIKSGSCNVMKKIPHSTLCQQTTKSDSSLVKKRTLPPLDPTLSHEQQIQRNLNSYLSYLDRQNPLVRTLVQPEINIPTRPEYNIPVKRRFSEATLKANLRRASFVLNTGLVDDESDRDQSEQTLQRKIPKTKAKVYFKGIISKQMLSNRNDQQRAEDRKDTEADNYAQKEDRFIVIQSLTKGMMFGIPDVMYDDQPGFSLVSNGAEIILIDKKFFLENCPQSLLTRLRREVYPLPGDKELKRRLRETLCWEKYRSETVGRLMKEIQGRNSSSV